MKTNSLLFILALAGCLRAGAQTPALVSDIDPGPQGSFPNVFAPFGTDLYFRATTAANGCELFKYSGTGAATLVYDLNPGAGDGLDGGFLFLPYRMVEAGGKLYFAGGNGTTGLELMSYSGSGAPGLAGAEIRSGSNASFPNELTLLDGKIYFSASDGTTGSELWVHDPGTATNTRLTDLYASGSSNVANLAVFGGKLYLSATSTGIGSDLFVYDPATNATTQVDMAPGDSEPANMTVIDGKMYFSAGTVSTGRELYAYDGTSAPVRLTDINPGSGNGVNFSVTSRAAITAYGGKIYFGGRTSTAGGFQLYAYTPSTNTTALVHTINLGGASIPGGFTPYAGKLYFSADDGTTGTELWMTDGTTTTRVADINPGADDGYASNLLVWKGRLYMSANNGTNGSELYSLADPAAVTALSFDGKATLYPNPTTHTATLTLDLRRATVLGVTLSDAAGRTVWASAPKTYAAGTNDLLLPLQNLPAGQYFYRAADEAGKSLVGGSIIRQ